MNIMVDWRAREIVTSAVMAAFGAMWLSAAWSASEWAPPYNVALKLAFAFTCFAVVANPFVLFERASFERLFNARELRALAFGFLAGLGILCALIALVLWLSKPLWHR
jgi:hypothetical protein